MTKRNGLSYTKLYAAHHNMKNRVLNENDINYRSYGGRGIKVCDEWEDEESGFINFYNWAKENGYEEGLTLERKDVNGDYKPDNCTWITWEEQANNKRNTVWITIDGETKTLGDWSKISGVNRRTIWQRFRNWGYEGEKLIESTKTKSGEKWIHWDEYKKKWRVRIIIDGVAKSFGKYASLCDAVEKRNLILMEHNMEVPQ